MLWRRLLDGAVVLAPPGEPTVLNRSAALAWDELAQPMTRAQLVARLTDRTDATSAVIGRDVEGLLAQLAALGAIEPADRASAP